MPFKRRFLSLSLLFLPFLLPAQHYNLPHNYNLYNNYEPYLNKRETGFHTAFRPYRQARVDQVVTQDSVYRLNRPDKSNFLFKAWNVLGYDHMIQVNTEDFKLSVDPVMNFSVGGDQADDRRTFINTRGFWITGTIGKNFSFATTFRENQAKYAQYTEDFIREFLVVPGEGRIRKFKNSGVDFANATGYISYTPSKFVNFQFGHDRHFVGDGYRSLLLSDNSYFYPYFKITTSVWKLQYTNLWMELQEPEEGASFVTGFQRKWGSFHYLSWNVWPWMQVGLFEGIVWQGSDSTGYRGLDINYLNPIIFFRPIEFGLGSPDNAIMGLNLKLIPLNNLILYGQFVLDDIDIARSREGEGFYRNKYGFQAGVKWYNVLGVRNLMLQAEYNQAQPYTYAHKYPTQNYSHYNQPLAHPLEANFQELILIGGYRYKRYYVDLKVQLAQYGEDTLSSHFGKNIFVSDFEIPDYPRSYGNSITQGVPVDLINFQARVGVILNPRLNWKFEVSYDMRRLRSEFSNQDTDLVSISLKTDLFNQYLDF